MKSRKIKKLPSIFEEFDRVPVEGIPSLGIATDIEQPLYTYGKGKARGTEGKKGSWVDMWGCVWEVGEDGVKGEVKQYLLSDWSKLNTFSAPWECLKEADLSLVNKQCEQSDKFVYHAWGTDPFQRMQFLRGTENLFMDLACGDLEVLKLRDMVHEFFMKEVEMWSNTNVDAIHLEDDWGTQTSLLISPKLWREFFKPLYRDYCNLAHSKGKYVIMHSDGNISKIIPDLIEIGVNAINAQIDCMNVEMLAELYHGKITFFGGFDRQHLLPFGTTDEVRSEVQRIAKAFFKYKRTGVIGQCYIDKGHKVENVTAVYDEWSKI